MLMTIRKAIPADIDRLAPLFDQYRIFYGQDSDIPGATRFLLERMQNEESIVFVAMEEDVMLGFTQLYPVFSSVGMKRAWILNDLYVVEEARGSGVADALLKRAQDMGIATGSRWLVLSTATDNLRAQKVYERNGWKRDEEFYSYYYYPPK